MNKNVGCLHQLGNINELLLAKVLNIISVGGREFALVWIVNVYMNLFGLIRQAIKKEKTEIEVIKKNKIVDLDTKNFVF